MGYLPRPTECGYGDAIRLRYRTALRTALEDGNDRAPPWGYGKTLSGVGLEAPKVMKGPLCEGYKRLEECVKWENPCAGKRESGPWNRLGGESLRRAPENRFWF